MGFTERSKKRIASVVRIVEREQGRRRHRQNPHTSTNPLKLAKTQEAAGSGRTISVKLLDHTGSEFGDSFNATFIMTDGGTAANEALPRVESGKTILVANIGDTWYVVNPTLIKSKECGTP